MLCSFPSPPLSHDQACSDKLKQEMADFGYPPVFPVDEEEASKVEREAIPTDPSKKAKKGKSKVLAKGSSLKYQWQIMKSLDMADEEVKRYVSPLPGHL